MTPIVIPYAPRAYQRAVHEAQERFRVVVAHRRAGKTVLFVNECIKGVVSCRLHEPRVAYIAPTQKMAKRIAWAYAKRYSAPIPGVKANASDLTLTYPNGGQLMLLGSEYADAIRGVYLDGAVIDEAALHSPRVLSEIVLPALLDRGGWLMVGGTPMGANQLKRIYEEARDGKEGWRAFMLKASQTGALSADALKVARANMSEAEYAQEMECSFNAVIKGAYYGKEMERAEAEGRICDVPYDPALPVELGIDLGMRDAFAVWFLQPHRTGGQVRAIRYEEFHGKGLPQVKAELDRIGLPVAAWYFPHDIAVRELGTGRSRREIAEELGMQVSPAVRMELADGIEATRAILPRMVFDRKRCAVGIDALRQYRAEWDEKNDIQRASPLHSWESHGADALRTFATARHVSARSDWSESLRDIQAREEAARWGRKPRAKGRVYA
jgi:phage terminase large subunit